MTAGAKIHIDDGIAVIGADALSSPGTFNPQTMAAFTDAVDTVLGDNAIRAAIVSQAGGLDLDWLMAATSPERTDQELSDAIARLNAVLQRMEGSRKLFVAAIDGPGWSGLSFEIALACHCRIAAHRADAQIGLTDARRGLPPAAGGALRLAKLIGGPAAQALLLAAQPMMPGEALKLGVIDEVVEPSDLITAAKRCVLQAPPPRPNRSGEAPPAIKALVNQLAPHVIHETLHQSPGMSFDTALDIAARRFVEVAHSGVARSMVHTLGISVARANSLARRPAGYDKRSFRKAAVLGAGLMGGGIALVCARAGLDVALLDVSQQAAERGLARLRRQEETAVSAGRADADAAHAALARIVPTESYAALHDADIVIEAVFEDRDVKADATRRAEAEMKTAAVLATNTSTLPITSLAKNSQRPDQFIGLHFFSPVPRMPLLEIIRGARTSDETLAIAMDFAQAIGKTPIIVNDARGFYTTRVVMAYQAEAFDMLAQGISAELIEEGGAAAGMPVPPLALSDAVALDLIHQINVQTRKDLGQSYHQSPGYELVARLVEQMRRTGKKVGQGFYDYGDDGQKHIWPGLAQAAGVKKRPASLEDVRDRLLAAQALETVRAMEEGVITDPSEADVGAILGWGFAPWTGGPLSYIDTMGTAQFVARCDDLVQRYGSERLRPPPSLRAIASRGASVYGTTWSIR
jgi:3-hydroxyacyl-CoA dehydrogenase/enoyl-CoA hydratase/3-hydroxybutyryl-CoA epimerase